MTFFPSLPLDGHLLHVFKKFQKGIQPLFVLHDDILRGPSDLSIGERELLAAYVSAMNDCSFCFNAHRVYAASFGINPEVFDALITDIETAPLDGKIKSVLSYARKLTLEPVKMVQADADAVFDAGWSESALHDAVLVISLFNFMNRIIFGHGLGGNDARYAARLTDVMTASPEERDEANASRIGAKDYQAFEDLVHSGKLPD